MRIINVNCKYYDEFGLCNHKERKNKFWIFKMRSTCPGMTKPVFDCDQREEYGRPGGPPPPQPPTPRKGCGCKCC